MAVNLVVNTQAALNTYQSSVHCWLDSTMALYWIKGQGEYHQFITNRVHKIEEHQIVTWHHVPTEDNQADLGSRVACMATIKRGRGNLGVQERMGRTRKKGKERLQGRYCCLHFSSTDSEPKNSDWSELIKCQSSA